MSKVACHILIVDDEEDILTAGRLLLKQHFTAVKTTSDPYQIPAILTDETIDVVLLDMNYIAVGCHKYNRNLRVYLFYLFQPV